MLIVFSQQGGPKVQVDAQLEKDATAASSAHSSIVSPFGVRNCPLNQTPTVLGSPAGSLEGQLSFIEGGGEGRGTLT